MFGSTRRYYRDITERILVLRNLFLYRAYAFNILMCIRISRRSYKTYSLFRTYAYNILTCIRILFLYYRAYTCTKVLVGTTHIHYTEVPVGTTGLILILQNLYLYYRYRSTRRYYRDFTCTKVPAGTTGQIQRYP